MLIFNKINFTLRLKANILTVRPKKQKQDFFITLTKKEQRTILGYSIPIAHNIFMFFPRGLRRKVIPFIKTFTRKTFFLNNIYNVTLRVEGGNRDETREKKRM